jgi:hypothetical protein
MTRSDFKTLRYSDDHRNVKFDLLAHHAGTCFTNALIIALFLNVPAGVR